MFFQKIIEDFEGRPEENLVRFLTLRSLKRAHYSPQNLGHLALHPNTTPTFLHTYEDKQT